MKKLLINIGAYAVAMVILYLLKDTIIPACDTYNSSINISVFLLHIVAIFSTILLVRKEFQDPNIRFLVNSGISVFYLLMMYLFLKFGTFLLICSVWGEGYGV